MRDKESNARFYVETERIAEKCLKLIAKDKKGEKVNKFYNVMKSLQENQRQKVKRRYRKINILARV